MSFFKIAEITASLFYIGFIPGAPGTYASVAGCIILYFLSFSSIPSQICLGGFSILVSMFSIKKLKVGEKDPPFVVIDEVAGMFVTMIGHRTDVLRLFIGFILFRFFDIIKPWPIKRIEKIGGPFGVVADDVLAGIYANLILSLMFMIVSF
ncbi:MAG: phosphatidylglycerophosphatase A [Syntrophorhabdaceae bacterium]|nr:phosphatidylglycerophosphatase A [Syntrophorhabdaceae bacterium]